MDDTINVQGNIKKHDIDVNIKLNRLFRLLILYASLGLVIAGGNFIAPHWVMHITHHSYIEKMIVSAALFGMFYYLLKITNLLSKRKNIN